MNKLKKMVAIACFVLIIICLLIRFYSIKKYDLATKEYADKEYSKALEHYSEILYFRDSKEKVEELKMTIADIEEKETVYQNAIGLYQEKAYSKASEEFATIIGYKDSEQYYNNSISYMEEAKENAYENAIKEYTDKDYDSALIAFSVLEDYRDSSEYVENCYNSLRRQLANTVSADTLYSVGISEKGIVLTGKSDIDADRIDREGLVSISSGVYYTAALYEDGHVDIWGDIPWYNKLENRTEQDVLQVSAGADYVAMLKKDRTVEYVGFDDANLYGEKLDFSNWRDILCIDSGYHLTAGLDNKGKVYVTGRNASEILKEIDSNKTEWEGVISIAVGGGDGKEDGFIIGLKKDGSVVCAGDIERGIIGTRIWSDIVSVSAADYHVIGLKKDGSVVAAINDDNNANWARKACCYFEGWPRNIIAVEAGNGISLGLTKDGTVYASGYDHQEQIPVNGEWDGIVVYSEWKTVK